MSAAGSRWSICRTSRGKLSISLYVATTTSNLSSGEEGFVSVKVKTGTRFKRVIAEFERPFCGKSLNRRILSCGSITFDPKCKHPEFTGVLGNSLSDNSKKQSLSNHLPAEVVDELLAAEAAQASGNWVNRSLLACFRFLRRLLLVTIVVYLLMIGCLALFENRLVYPGSKYPAGNWEQQGQGFEEVEFAAADETKLVGWYLPLKNSSPADAGSASATRPRTILHCHGNGENIAQGGSYTAKRFSTVLQANVFIFDYRGFGKSEGSPNEAGVKQDADAALAWVCEKDNVQPTDVIIVGHSLGGGLACYLAEKHGCKGLILQRTFSSLPDAAARTYPMFPVHWVMRNQLNSAEAIKSCDVPLFQSHGEKDTLVPIDLGRKLFANCPSSTKQFLAVPEMTHWGALPEHYWTELKAFFDQVDPRQPDHE